MAEGQSTDEPQILLGVPGDASDSPRRRQIFLHKIWLGRWVGFTPDPDFYFMGLNEGRHPAFTRTGPFPVNIRDHVYAFDPVSVKGFRRLERDGRRWAQLLGEGDEADVEDEVWVIAEFEHPRLGEVVRDRPLELVVLGEPKAMVILDDGELFMVVVECPGVLELAQKEYVIKRQMESNVHLLRNHQSDAGRRESGLRESMPLFCWTLFEAGASSGPRGVNEDDVLAVLGVDEATGSLDVHHPERVRRSWFAEVPSVAFEHHILVKTFCLSMGIDQLGISSLASFEEWARRQALLEMEMARSARDPDLAGPDAAIGGPPAVSGQVTIRWFSQCVTNWLIEQARIWRQTRPYRPRRSDWRRTPDPDASDGEGRAPGEERDPQGQDEEGGNSAPAGFVLAPISHPYGTKVALKRSKIGLAHVHMCVHVRA